VRFPVVVLKCLGDSIEVPLLGLSIVSPSLEPDVVGTVTLSNSVEWKLGDKIEWSVNMEAKVFVESLSLDGICFIKINHIPDLSFRSIVAPYLNWISFLDAFAQQDHISVRPFFRSSCVRFSWSHKSGRCPRWNSGGS